MIVPNRLAGLGNILEVKKLADLEKEFEKTPSFAWTDHFFYLIFLYLYHLIYLLCGVAVGWRAR